MKLHVPVLNIGILCASVAILSPCLLKAQPYEGRFDRNWKVPEADAAKMKETGAVTIR